MHTHPLPPDQLIPAARGNRSCCVSTPPEAMPSRPDDKRELPSRQHCCSFRSIAFGKRIKIPRRVYRAGAPGGNWWPGASLAPAPQSPGTPSSPRTRARGGFILASLTQFVIQRPLTALRPQVFAALAPGEAPGSGTSGAGAPNPSPSILRASVSTPKKNARAGSWPRCSLSSPSRLILPPASPSHERWRAKWALPR